MTIDSLILAVIYLLSAFVLFFIGKVVFDKINSSYSLNDELVERDNVALAVAMVGYYLGLTFAIGGVISGPSAGLGEDMIDIMIYGPLAIILMNVSAVINNKLILYKFDTTKEVITDQNVGTGVVECAVYLATGMIIYGSISGEDGSVITAVAFWGLGQVALVLTGQLYNLITPYDIHEHIEKDNVAVGVSFAGALIAIGNIIRHAVSGSFDSWNDNLETFASFIILSFIFLPVIRIVTDKILLPGAKITDELINQKKPNLGVAVIEAFSYIGASFFIVWSLETVEVSDHSPTSKQASQNPLSKTNASRYLKICLFATGFAGIVAEFVLATLASYLLGNAILQWTLVMSFMLFAMGVGSRFSKHFHSDLLDHFIGIEFLLSLLCATSAAICYTIAPYTSHTSLIIYTIAIAIGLLIGMEIPLVTRINDSYENLRTNISSVMENDYYGALAGGLVFAFFALPKLGLTYTPVALGMINFSIASILLWKFYDLVKYRALLKYSFFVVTVLLLALLYFIKPIMIYGEQSRYRDKIIFSKQTTYQKIVVTQWKDYYWLYINGHGQFSSYDEERYHEPLVHPAMLLSPSPKSVLIMGGGDGLAIREVLKHKKVEKITLVDLDPAMTDLGKNHVVFQKLNGNSMSHKKVTIINKDAYLFLQGSMELYDVIIIDLPDPSSIQLARLYSLGFYKLCERHLSKHGIVVTQSASPLYTSKALRTIIKTMESAGFTILPYHNQIPTMGEWSWSLGVRDKLMNKEDLKSKLQKLEFEKVETKFLNQEAMVSMVHFGKGVFDTEETVEINTELNPVLDRYYREGAWELY